MNKLIIKSEEQTIALRDGYSAELRYNVFNRYWYYNLIDPDGVYVLYGQALIVNSCPSYRLVRKGVPMLVLFDEALGNKEPYNPFVEISGRLGLYEL